MHTDRHSFSANLIDVFKHHSATLCCFCSVANVSSVKFIMSFVARNSRLKFNSSDLFPASVSAFVLLEDY